MALKGSFGQRLSRPVYRYVLAILATGVTLLLRYWLDPFIGHHYPYQTAWLAVVFSAWFCGVGPSILTTFLLLFGAWYLFMPSATSLAAFNDMQLAGMLGFLTFSAVAIVLAEAVRRSRARQQQIDEALRGSENQLKRALETMQKRIEQRTVEVEEKTLQMMEQARLLDLANDAILVRTADNRISYWNRGAERLYGWSRGEALGRLTHELLRTPPIPTSEIAKTELWEGELVQIRRDGSQITVASRWTTLRDGEGKFAGWLEINTDITARKRAEDAARRLSGRILSLQDDERRRIARELHDSLGQYLVSLKVNLDLLARTLNNEQQEKLLLECIGTTDQCLTETRTISHLLHPPLLDEAGFASAARWYIEGFARRSAFEIKLDLPPHLERLDRDLETALFRVLQEALTNVHRHSGGSLVNIQMQVDAERVQLEIRDDGRGIPEQRLRRFRDDPSSAGVGLAGMRERVRELGGALDIASSATGTTITVTVPILQKEESPCRIDGRMEGNQDSSPRVSAA